MYSYKTKPPLEVKRNEVHKVVHPDALPLYCRKLGLRLTFELSSWMYVLIVDDLPLADSVVNEEFDIRRDVPFSLRAMLRVKIRPAEYQRSSGRYGVIEPELTKSVYESIPALSASVVEYERKVTEVTEPDKQLEARQAQVGSVSSTPSYGNHPDFIKGYQEASENRDLSPLLELTPQGQVLLDVASGVDGVKAALSEFSETGTISGAMRAAGHVAFESYVDRKLKIPSRPSWKQSELDVTERLNNQGFRTQISFKDGVEVPYGTKGSTRPEAYLEGLSVEVKNYNVETAKGRNSLVRNISTQAKHRANNLPVGTRQQVNIDVRGQNVSRTELNKIIKRVVRNSNGAVKAEDINILR